MSRAREVTLFFITVIITKTISMIRDSNRLKVHVYVVNMVVVMTIPPDNQISDVLGTYKDYNNYHPCRYKLRFNNHMIVPLVWPRDENTSFSCALVTSVISEHFALISATTEALTTSIQQQQQTQQQIVPKFYTQILNPSQICSGRLYKRYNLHSDDLFYGGLVINNFSSLSSNCSLSSRFLFSSPYLHFLNLFSVP